MASRKKSSYLSPVKKRQVESAVSIDQSPGTIDDAVFQHSILCQVFLPYKNPGDDVSVWKRKQGKATILLEAGQTLDRHTNDYRSAGLPYGSNARLLLTYANTQAVKTGESTVTLGKSLNDLLRFLGKNSFGKRTRDSVDDQLHRLTATRMKLGFVEDLDDATRVRGANLELISEYDLWYSKDGKQELLFPSYIKFGDKYFEHLMKHAVPLDERALFSLSKDAMAMDIYAWLAQRLYRIDPYKPDRITWKAIKDQFGQGYKNMDDFKKKFREKMRKVLLQYQDAKLDEDTNKAFVLHHSPPPIRKQIFQVITNPKLK